MPRRKKKKNNYTASEFAESFKKIRRQIEKKHTNSFHVSTWSNSNGKLFLPYTKRIKPMLDMCGKYDLGAYIPDDFKVLPSRFFTVGDGKSSIHANFKEFINSITDEEFKSAKVSNTRLHTLLAASNLGGRLKKPKLVSIIELFYNEDIIGSCKRDSMIKSITERGVKGNTSHVYFSCDPWDIMRMGVGCKAFGSCMNIVEKGCFSNKLPENLMDANMGVAYVESDSKLSKIDGMMARMILRVLNTPVGYAAVLDRMYGEKTLRPPIKGALLKACRDHGLKFMEFYHYMPHIGSRSTISGKGEPVWGCTNTSKYKTQLPYIDNSSGCGFRKMAKSEKTGFGLFKLAYDKEDQ